MTPEDAKLWADRKRTILSYIEQERHRCMALIMAIDNDKGFLLWCLDQSYIPREIERARELYDQLQPIEDQMIDDASQRIPDETDIEDLM